uniref:Secreted protein n=1 Tax=Achlya hypogyna TaxID=1202772 RepID=A0A0A7CNP7_ACHHY|nr:secreted protein [Achlya hypogyna]
MVRYISALALACLASSAASAEWTMKKVRSVQARVQATAPVYDTKKEAWVAIFQKGTDTFTQRYRAAMDTINTASVEGALMYVQAEGIDKSVNANCMRKVNMSYIWFYDITIVQPTAAVAEFGETAPMAEYCPFVALDLGMCTPIGTQIPAECKEIDGLDGFPKLGPCVGGEPRKDDPRAPYENNIWFSYPNSCYTKPFDRKDETCRQAQRGGLCEFGKEPDGVTCTFSFNVLGYIAIDDVVGITSMVNERTGKAFSGFREFCTAGLVEYDSTTKESIPFWKNPLNRTANEARSLAMMEMYNAMVNSSSGTMKPLPSVCEVCSSPAADCVKRPASAAPFPTLTKVERKVDDSKLISNTTGQFGKNSTGKGMSALDVKDLNAAAGTSAGISTTVSTALLLAAVTAVILHA